MRLDRFLANLPELSRRDAQMLIAGGRLRVDGQVVRDGTHEVDRRRAAGFHTEQISSAFRGRQAPGGNCGSRQISPMRSRCRRSTLLSKWPNMRLTW